MTGTDTAGDGAQPRDPFAVDVEHALEVLRLVWGDAYDIGFERAASGLPSAGTTSTVSSAGTPRTR